jgi:tRNA splicing ligase
LKSECEKERARLEADPNAAEYKQQIDKLKGDLRANADASEREKAQMLKKINSKRSALARALVTAGLGIIPEIVTTPGSPGVFYPEFQ